MRILTKDQLDRCLMAMLGNMELVERWWHSPNHAFDMKTPMESDWEKVQNYILGYLQK